LVFKRRDRRPIWKIVLDFLYPRGGWARAFGYVKHRLRRLPDTPEKISRGIASGVFAAFTPFYGLHFVIAILLARITRGNILAALLGTFAGNPLTYIPIGIASLGTGYWILGRPFNAALFGLDKRVTDDYCTLGCQFSNAFADIVYNVVATFTADTPHWTGLIAFYHEVFVPYLIGGIAPGLFFALLSYYLFVPIIAAYQKRRRKALQAKLDQLKK
jgi:uncharacterized protein